MQATKTTTARKSDQLLRALTHYDQLLIVMHDNPDPDAIAAGWAVRTLIEERLGTTTRLIGGGAIVRAENRHMVDLLGPPIQLVLSVEVPENSAPVLVDCSPGATNQLLTRGAIQPVAVIDHHLTAQVDRAIPFVDVRTDVAASATIAASYLREQGVEPGPKLATAMIYAMRTETHGSESHYSKLDNSILVWLTERAEPALLAEIENAPLSREYFGDLAAAMASTTVYQDVAFCMLPRAHGPEIVGEVADLLIRCVGIHRALCAAVVNNDLLLSARTEREDDNACDLIQQTLEGLGGGGGHGHRAGGKIAGVNGGTGQDEEMHQEVLRRWLIACCVEDQAGEPLLVLGGHPPD